MIYKAKNGHEQTLRCSVLTRVAPLKSWQPLVFTGAILVKNGGVHGRSVTMFLNHSRDKMGGQFDQRTTSFFEAWENCANCAHESTLYLTVFNNNGEKLTHSAIQLPNSCYKRLSTWLLHDCVLKSKVMLLENKVVRRSGHVNHSSR